LCFNSSDDNRLNGTLPLSLFELPKLSVLNLGKLWRKGKHKNERSCYFLQTKIASCLYVTGLNFLEGTLPSEIGNAKALKVLDLRELIQSLMIISSASCIHFFVHFLVLHKQGVVGYGMDLNGWEQTNSRGRSPPKLVQLPTWS